MEPERWQRVKCLFDAARELPPTARASFLRERCSGDPSLHGSVESLLAAAEERKGFLESLGTLPSTAVAPRGSLGRKSADAAADAPASIGNYRILSRLGEGGMGVVYEAEQQHPRRKVALKVIRGGRLVDETSIRMFQREVKTLARLNHPNIGAIYESGRTDDGQSFFAMELVRGRTLDAHLGRQPKLVTPAELDRRLRLFRQIADAVNYAHQRGVIHRDLKPSNIIVTEETSQNRTGADNGRPEIKILDFGLARITDSDVSATRVTEVGQIKGTLPYMSPEQARGDPDAIDLRTDVYTLGVILYELLTGRRPYDVSRGSLVEAIRVICEEPPRPMGRSWSGVRKLDPDLETIVGKALEKVADRRYGSAAALAEDIQRYLTAQPILARPPSAVYRFRKFAQRNKVLLTSAALLLLTLTAGLVTTSLMYLRARDSELDARREGYVANLRAAEISLRSNDVREARARLAAADPEHRGWEWGHLDLRLNSSEFELELPVSTPELTELAFAQDGTSLMVTGVQLRNLRREPLLHVIDTKRGVARDTNLVPPSIPQRDRWLAVSGDGRWWIVQQDASGDLVRYDARSPGAEPRVLVRGLPPRDTSSSCCSFDAANLRVAVVVTDDRPPPERSGRIEVLDVATAGRIALVHPDPDARLWGVSLSPDGNRLAAVVKPPDGPSWAMLWDLSGGVRALPPLHATAVSGDVLSGSVTFSRDGKLLAAIVGESTYALEVWDVETGATKLSYPVGGRTWATAFDPGATRVAVGRRDGTVELASLGEEPRGAWHFSTPSYKAHRLRRWWGPANRIVSVAFDPDGSRVAAMDGSGNVFAWWAGEDRDRRRFGLPLSHSLRTATGASSTGWASPVVATAAGHVLTVRPDGSIVTADLLTGEVVSDTADASFDFEPRRERYEQVSLSRDGGIAAAHRASVEVWIRDARTGRTLRTLDVVPGAESIREASVHQTLMHPDGDRLATVTGDGVVQIWAWRVAAAERLPDPEPSIHFGEERDVQLAFTPDGGRLAAAGRGGVALWDLGRHRWLRVLSVPDAPRTVRDLTFDGVGRFVAASLADPAEVLLPESVVAIWNTATGLLVPDTGASEPAWGHAFVFSPDGQRLILGARHKDQTYSLRVYETAAFSLLNSFDLESRLQPTGFDPMGRHLLLAAHGLVTDVPVPIEVWRSDREPRRQRSSAPVEERTTIRSEDPYVGDSEAKPVVRDLATAWDAPEAPEAGTRAVLRVGDVEYAFRYTPPATVQIGSAYGEPCRDADRERPWTAVISHGFWIGETEVTRELWQEVMGSAAGHFASCGRDCPVELVSWDDVLRFIAVLDSAAGGRFRLPTEVEWEYAARAGRPTPFGLDCEDYEESSCGGFFQRPSPLQCVDAFAWYRHNADGRVHAVGQKAPNPWGLYDIHGNVAEWCADALGRYPTGEHEDYRGPDAGRRRVARGGSFLDDPLHLRAASRDGLRSDAQAAHVGFRLVREARDGAPLERSATSHGVRGDLAGSWITTRSDGEQLVLEVLAHGGLLTATRLTGEAAGEMAWQVDAATLRGESAAITEGRAVVLSGRLVADDPSQLRFAFDVAEVVFDYRRPRPGEAEALMADREPRLDSGRAADRSPK